jgi:hypothetical protein
MVQVNRSSWVCQLELAHFDAFIWPTLEANDLSGAGWSEALRRPVLRRVMA